LKAAGRPEAEGRSIEGERPGEKGRDRARNAAPARMGDVVRLAWPAILSYVLNNGYRINDQYFVQGLGPDAHAAIASSTFVLIMNFGVIFLAVGGALPLVARAAGAGDRRLRDDWIRHAFALGLVIALVLGALGSALTPTLARWLAVGGGPAEQTAAYLGTIYVLILPLVLAPILDNVFIALGDTRTPMLLQACAVALNVALNPILIYGLGGFSGLGIAGAAVATCLSRAAVVLAGLLLLRSLHGVRFRRLLHLRLARMIVIARVGLPTGLSILFYAAVYWALFPLVLVPLGRDAVAGLGIGFNAFESFSFPFFLGIALAGSSLVGRNLGAGDGASALLAVRNVRRIARLVGAAFTLLFLFGGPFVAPLFTDDPGVLAETLGYVSILAWSQYLVAEEVVNEKVLLGAGLTRPIFWYSTIGNLLRIPLAYVLALPLGYAAAGVWWAINLTTWLKAALFFREVQRRTWLTSSLP